MCVHVCASVLVLGLVCASVGMCGHVWACVCMCLHVLECVCGGGGGDLLKSVPCPFHNVPIFLIFKICHINLIFVSKVSTRVYSYDLTSCPPQNITVNIFFISWMCFFLDFYLCVVERT